MVELLAALSLSAAAGMRVALPLLLIGLLHRDRLWATVPLLSHIPPQIVLGVLVSWSLAELLISKERMGLRILQMVQLVLSPVVGAIAGVTIARTAEVANSLIWIIALVSGLFAFVLQLVQVGWFFRLQGLPLSIVFLQDFLCVSLVLFAFDAPRQGGLIALLLFWLAIRSSKEWHRWHYEQTTQRRRKHKEEKMKDQG